MNSRFKMHVCIGILGVWGDTMFERIMREMIDGESMKEKKQYIY